MLTVKAHYNQARVFAEFPDQSVLDQLRTLLDCEAFADSRIAVMPDCHAGKGSVVGFTMTLNRLVVPNVIGVDIGCGVECYATGARDIDYKDFDRFLRENVPSGFSRRAEALATGYGDGCYTRVLEHRITEVCRKIALDTDTAFQSIGTLGGGNHFMELERDENGLIYFTVHTGSRHFGLKVAEHHQDKARRRAIRLGLKVTPGLESLPIDDEGAEYLEDMKTAQAYAAVNRRAIARLVLEGYFGLALDKVQHVASVHNYIDFDAGVIRKGAISARQDEDLLIPLNMRDGLVLGKGLGNPEWNFSAPHGAGRRMSRNEARRKLSVGDFEISMRDVWSSTVGKATLDEAPMAYKPARQILEAVGPAVKVEKILKPVYNFKAAE